MQASIRHEVGDLVSCRGVHTHGDCRTRIMVEYLVFASMFTLNLFHNKPPMLRLSIATLASMEPSPNRGQDETQTGDFSVWGSQASAGTAERTRCTPSQRKARHQKTATKPQALSLPSPLRYLAGTHRGQANFLCTTIKDVLKQSVFIKLCTDSACLRCETQSSAEKANVTRGFVLQSLRLHCVPL